MAMLENKMRMNWEKSRNLKSREFSRFMVSAISRAFPLYLDITMWNTFTFTRTRCTVSSTMIIHG